MKGFAGFPAVKESETTRLPDLFFSELLPEIDHLGELKVTLHVFWLLTQKKGERRYVSGQELAADRRLLDGLAAPGMPPQEALQRCAGAGCGPAHAAQGIHRRGELAARSGISSTAKRAGRRWTTCWPASGRRPRPRAGAAPGPAPQHLCALRAEHRPPYAPAGRGADGGRRHLPGRVDQDAFREAVEVNKRKLAVYPAHPGALGRRGKRQMKQSRRGDEGDWRRFIEGEYADYIEH